MHRMDKVMAADQEGVFLRKDVCNGRLERGAWDLFLKSSMMFQMFIDNQTAGADALILLELAGDGL